MMHTQQDGPKQKNRKVEQKERRGKEVGTKGEESKSCRASESRNGSPTKEKLPPMVPKPVRGEGRSQSVRKVRLRSKGKKNPEKMAL